jgi:hypothetical protein
MAIVIFPTEARAIPVRQNIHSRFSTHIALLFDIDYPGIPSTQNKKKNSRGVNLTT